MSPADQLRERRRRPRFLLDVMLGRLARWLRALGHNAAYDHAADDPSLLRRAARERRLLVTRDTRLAAAPRGSRVVLLRANDTPGQLRELLTALGIDERPGFLTRCLVCNTRLRGATADQIETRVPEYVRSVERSFRACPGCGRVYWAGTHRRGIIAALESAVPGLRERLDGTVTARAASASPGRGQHERKEPR
jgi:uncharacterized protein